MIGITNLAIQVNVKERKFLNQNFTWISAYLISSFLLEKLQFSKDIFKNVDSKGKITNTYDTKP